MKLTKAMRERFEYGEIEREISRERQMVPPGSFFDRMFGWLQGLAQERREEADELVQDEMNAGRAALARDTEQSR